MTKIVVLGAGGAGCYLAEQIKLKIDCYSLALDKKFQSLDDCNVDEKIELDDFSSNGHSFTLNHDQLKIIRKHLESATTLVFAAGLGGETGSVVCIEVAKLAKSMNIKTIFVGYKPMSFELVRYDTASEVESLLKSYVDEMIIHDHAQALPANNSSQTVLEYFKNAAQKIIGTTLFKLHSV